MFQRLKECFDNQINAAYNGKSSYDLKWWTENFGADMPRNWPKFEVCDIKRMFILFRLLWTTQHFI